MAAVAGLAEGVRTASLLINVIEEFPFYRNLSVLTGIASGAVMVLTGNSLWEKYAMETIGGMKTSAIGMAISTVFLAGSIVVFVVKHREYCAFMKHRRLGWKVAPLSPVRQMSDGGVPKVVSVSKQTVPEVVSVSKQTVPEVVSVSKQTVPEVVSVSKQTVPKVVSVSKQTVPKVVSVSKQTVPKVVSVSKQTVPKVVSVSKQTVPKVVSVSKQTVPEDVSTSNPSQKKSKPRKRWYQQ